MTQVSELTWRPLRSLKKVGIFVILSDSEGSVRAANQILRYRSG